MERIFDSHNIVIILKQDLWVVKIIVHIEEVIVKLS